jgi:hypothetical protein
MTLRRAFAGRSIAIQERRDDIVRFTERIRRKG